MTFGTRLTEARKAKKLTQEQLGKGLGTDGKDCSKAVVYGWEKNQHMPRADQLAMICERLDASADYLLFGKAEPVTKLLPDVAQLALEMNQLRGDGRRLVIETARLAISHANLLERHATDEQDAQVAKQTPYSERARKAT